MTEIAISKTMTMEILGDDRNCNFKNNDNDEKLIPLTLATTVDSH